MNISTQLPFFLKKPVMLCSYAAAAKGRPPKQVSPS